MLLSSCSPGRYAPEHCDHTRYPVRARMRKLLSTPFNAQSLLEQAPTLENYAEVVIDRLLEIHREKNIGKEETVVNMPDWVNFYTVDVMGDLAIGESFHCLEQSSYHPWVETLYMFFTGMIIAAAVRFFPGGVLYSRIWCLGTFANNKDSTLSLRTARYVNGWSSKGIDQILYHRSSARWTRHRKR